MKLSFYAKLDKRVRLPGYQPHLGQPDVLVGRKFDPKTRGYPATSQPFECESDSDVGRRLMRLTRIDDALWPADRETAEACGIPFVSVQFRDGVWMRSSTTRAAAKAETPTLKGE